MAKHIKAWQTVGKWVRSLQTPSESAISKSKFRHERKQIKRQIAGKMK